jgi:hypothetical protein
VTFAASDVRVASGPYDLKRRHEGPSLSKAGRQLLGRQLVPWATSDLFLGLVISVFAYPAQSDAITIVDWLRADGAIPGVVVPRDSDR